MKFKHLLSIISAISVVWIIGCSSSTNPVTSSSSSFEEPVYKSLPVAAGEFSSDGRVSGGMGTLGLFQIHIDPSNLSGELISMRQGMLPDVLEVVDITNFLQLVPCTDCVKIQSVSLNDDGNVVVSIGIRHPFEAPSWAPIGFPRFDLHVFNVEGIVISNNPVTHFSGIGRRVADFRLINASGYTGYLDGVIDSFYPTNADIHPYILHFDDYSSGNFNPEHPNGFEDLGIPPPTGNLVMAMGSDYDFKDYIFDHSDGAVNFIYAVGCTFGISAKNKMYRGNPEYRIPQFNKKAASEVWVDIIENDLAEGDTESSATLLINVVDISHGVPVGDALNEMRADSSVIGVSVEIPGIVDGSVSFSIDPLSGTGHDPSDPLVFEGEIANSAGGTDGTYLGLVKVTDSYPPGLNIAENLNGKDGIERVGPYESPLEGLFVIDEFATYQVFSIDVGVSGEINVIVPNGGEAWQEGSNQEIIWTSEDIIGTVFIEYSKDDFNAHIHTIATGVPNTGSYIWEDIPDDKSDTVKVRISSTQHPFVYDISDDYFSIISSGSPCKNIPLRDDARAIDITIDHNTGDLLVLYEDRKIYRYQKDDCYENGSLFISLDIHHTRIMYALDMAPNEYLGIALTYVTDETPGLFIYDPDGYFVQYLGQAPPPPIEAFAVTNGTYKDDLGYVRGRLNPSTGDPQVFVLRATKIDNSYGFGGQHTYTITDGNYYGYDRLYHEFIKGVEADMDGDNLWFLEDPDYYASRWYMRSDHQLVYDNAYFGTGYQTDADNGWNNAKDITRDNQNRYFVLDHLSTGEPRVKVWTVDGNETTSIGSFGNSTTINGIPRRIEGSDYDGDIIVLHGNNPPYMISVFEPVEMPG